MKKCSRCKEYFIPCSKDARIKYCGSKTNKIGCSYIEHRLKNNRSKNRWQKNNFPKMRAYRNKWSRQNKFKIKAHQLVHKAIRKGEIKPADKCEICFISCKTEGHHEDYSKPLEVIWLCRSCHAKK